MRTCGASWICSRPARQRGGLALFAALIVTFMLSACGGGTSDPPEAVTPPDNLVSQAETDKFPANSVKRALLEFWSDLQYQSWAEVASYYDPAFRNSIGTAAIIGGKKINGGSYPSLKPGIVRVRTERGLTTVNYTLVFIDGTRELASISWLKEGGNWQIVFDSRLDAELTQFAANKTEYAQNGALPTDPAKTSPEAGRAGNEAGQAQARFLQQDFDLTSP